MYIRHDPENNIAYIRFFPEMLGTEQLKIASDANVHIASNGEVCGVQLLNANMQIGTSITFKNQKTEIRQEMPL
jgi:uncharacterized protein YuzE